MFINFKKVRWKNLLSTGNVFTEISLDSDPTTLIVGKNGNGKSTIIEAITFALYGKPFRKINKPQLINSINQKGLLVEIEFETGGKSFLIRRGMKPNIFEIFQNDVLINQDAANRDYQDYLEKHILKWNFKSFTQIVILGSRSFVPFMQLPLGGRREVIEDLLDMQIFSAMNTLLKQKILDNKNEIRETSSRIEVVQHKINIHKEYVKSLAKNTKKQIEINQNTIDDYLTDIQNMNIVIEELNSKLEEIYTKLHEYKDLEYRYSNMYDMIRKVKERISKIKSEISFYDNNESCPTCKQGIEHDFKDTILHDKKISIKEGEETLSVLEKSLSILEKQKTEYNNFQTEYSKIESTIAESKIKIRSMTDFVKKIEADNERLSKEHSETVSTMDNVQEHKNMLNSLTKSYEGLLADRSTYDVVSVLLKDGGLKSKIIKQYIPLMNKYINKYLAALELLCVFELDENFNEVVKSRYKDEFSYDSFSEGEKSRIDIAMLFAWRDIARVRNSSSTNLLILDEVFDSALDSNGTDELLKILSLVSNQSNIFVISHKGDSLIEKFDNVIAFEKSKNFSHMVGSE